MEPLAMYASGLLPWLVEVQVRSLVVLMLAGVALVILRRSSAALRHLVLALAVASLFILPLLSLVLPSWSVPTTATPTVSLSGTTETVATGGIDAPPQQSQQSTAPVAIPRVTASAPETPKATSRSVALRQEMAVEPRLEPAPVRTRQIVPLIQGAVLLWGIGTLLLLFRLVSGVLRVRNLAKNAQRASVAAPALVEQGILLVASLGLRFPVRFLIGALNTPGLSPMTWGLWRPVVLLPADAANWSAERVQPVLLHELAHVQRGDWATELLARVVCALYWPNPLVWLLVRRLQSESERACDDTVLRAGITPAEYARHLVEVVRELKARRTSSAPMALTMGRKSDVEGRVRAILAGSRTRKPANGKMGALALVITVGLLLPLASLRGARAGGQKANPSSPPVPDVTANTATTRPGELRYPPSYPDSYRKTIWAANGIRVDLLPVFGCLADGRAAKWYPDGSNLTPFTNKKAYPHGQRIVAARVFFPTEDMSFKALLDMEFEGAPINVTVPGATLGEWRDNTGNNAPLIYIGRVFPESQKRVTLHLRLATGERKTIIAGGPKRTTTWRLSNGEVATISPAYRAPMGILKGPGREVTYVKVTVPLRLGDERSDFRLYPVGWDGKIIETAHGGGGARLSKDKQVATLTFTLRTSELPLSKVKEFRFVARPVHVIKVSDIALQPNQASAENLAQKVEQAGDKTPIRLKGITFYNDAIPTARRLARMKPPLTPEDKRILQNMVFSSGIHQFANGVVAHGLTVRGLLPDGSLAAWDRKGNLLSRSAKAPNDSKSKPGDLYFDVERLELPGMPGGIDSATMQRLIRTGAIEAEFGIVGQPERRHDFKTGLGDYFTNGFGNFNIFCRGNDLSASAVDLYLTIAYGSGRLLGASSLQHGVNAKVPGSETITMTPIVTRSSGAVAEVIATVPARFTRKDSSGRRRVSLRLEPVDAAGNLLWALQTVQYDETPPGSPVTRLRLRMMTKDVPLKKLAAVRLLARPLETVYFRSIPTQPTQIPSETP